MNRQGRGMSASLTKRMEELMNDGLFEDYGEAIFYVMLSAMICGLMAVTIGAFTAF